MPTLRFPSGLRVDFCARPTAMGKYLKQISCSAYIHQHKNIFKCSGLLKRVWHNAEGTSGPSTVSGNGKNVFEIEGE